MFSFLFFGGMALVMAGGSSLGRTIALKEGPVLTGVTLVVAGMFIVLSAL